MRIGTVITWIAAATFIPFEANATLGVFEHGSGIKSLGEGGISYVPIDETTVIAGNPASAVAVGNRFDVGIDMLSPDARATISGNSLGPDTEYDSDAHHFYPIPQGGVTFRLNRRWSAGATMYAGGLGPDYTSSPYARFATPENADKSRSASLTLKISGLSFVLANAVTDHHTLGVSLNVQHEALNVKGLSPFAGVSQYPEEVSDEGKHGAWGGSFTVGWTGQLTSWMDAGLSYRSKSWSHHIEAYRGLIPDSGLLELPAIYGGAVSFTPVPRLKVSLEFQRADYGSRNAFGNGVEKLGEGYPLGSADGPGFGWSDQNAYKLGLSYQLLTSLRVRAGYVYNTLNFPATQTLFNLMAPATIRDHYTAGATWSFCKVYELSGYAGIATRGSVSGQHSIPAAFGGGNASVSNEMYMIGISLGKRFGH